VYNVTTTKEPRMRRHLFTAVKLTIAIGSALACTYVVAQAFGPLFSKALTAALMVG